MKPVTALLSLGLALVACNSSTPRATPARPTPSRAPTPTTTPTTTAAADAAVDAPLAPLRVFALEGSECVRTTTGRAYGPNAHPVFTRGILEVELRSFLYACSKPEFEPSIVNDTLVLNAPTRRDPNNCTCRHDLMLQVTGVPASVTQVRFVRPNPATDGGVDEILSRAVDTRARPAPVEPTADASTGG